MAEREYGLHWIVSCVTLGLVLGIAFSLNVTLTSRLDRIDEALGIEAAP